VPVRPDVMLQRIVDELGPDAGELPGSVLAARFTLPFGILAGAVLARPLLDRPHGAYVSWNRPVGQSLTGAHQLRVDAVDLSLPDGPPSLPGYTVQLPVASPGYQSVLADTIDTFNTYLGVGGARPLVPLVRLDVSGYGESVFSDWRNPYNDPVAVAQARFDVLIGRTSYEVIQIRSWLFPYAVEVVRTFTMQRQNNAAVIRTDSGWVAVTDGEYAFPNGLRTHPGVVTKISKVSRIRETGQIVTQDGYEVAIVYFNGDLTLDGAADPVAAKDQVGFVQLAPAGALLDATTYADLIASIGPLGGPVDASINIGGGPQVAHLNHVDVGVTSGMGGPEFVMTEWGAPAFPGGGQWSMVRVPGPGQPATPVDKARGAPLIRAGLAGTPAAPSSAYRFSDPADLAQPDNPAQDYAILHAMGTQRALFSRPKIEATDVTRITSTQVAALADPYVLAASPGPFPPLTAAVPTPSSDWSLQVDGSGNYRLDLPGTDFPVSVGRRTARQAGSVKSDLDYSGAAISYAVDTSEPVPWTFRMTGAAKIMNTASLGDITTLRANVVAAAGSETRFEDPRLQMGGSLSVVQDLLTILADLGITGFLSVSMTNDWDLKVTEKIPIVDQWGRAYQIPPLPPPPVPDTLPDPQIKFDDCEISCDTNVAPANDEAEFDLAGAPMFAVRQVPGLYVVAVFKFSIKVSTADGTTYGLLLGVGIAYDKELGIFEFKGLFAITFFGFIIDTAIGFGIGFLLQLSASIEPIIEVQFSVEGQLALVWGCRGTPDETLFGAAKLTIAVEVTVCLCFSISIEASTTASEIIQGPNPSPCPLPDVLPSAS
jgi:hypothetical protein